MKSLSLASLFIIASMNAADVVVYGGCLVTSRLPSLRRVAVNEGEFVNEGRIWRMGYAYQIPYRALTPKAAECTNLLVPGAASFTHGAFCTLRLESVWMITGHAAGIAAALAVKDDVAVQKVPLATLQDKLRAQKQVVDFIPGLPEKCEHLNGPPEF